MNLYGKQFCELMGGSVEWGQAKWLGGMNSLSLLFIHSIFKELGEAFDGGISIGWAAFKKYSSYFGLLTITDPLQLLLSLRKLKTREVKWLS